jgi:hypothetical protein
LQEIKKNDALENMIFINVIGSVASEEIRCYIMMVANQSRTMLTGKAKRVRLVRKAC